MHDSSNSIAWSMCKGNSKLLTTKTGSILTEGRSRVVLDSRLMSTVFKFLSTPFIVATINSNKIHLSFSLALDSSWMQVVNFFFVNKIAHLKTHLFVY